MPGRLPLCNRYESRTVFSPELESRLGDAIEQRIQSIADKLEARALAAADKLGDRMHERAVQIADSTVRTSVKAGASELRNESAVEWQRIKAGTPWWLVPAMVGMLLLFLLR